VISSPKTLLPYLATLGISPKKALSQNFLIDANIIHKLIDAACIEPGDWVLEIGPGAGALTEVLLAKGAHVIAVEKDPALARGLSHLQTEDKRLHIHCCDILDFPLQELGHKAKVVSNLPFHISSPILTRLVPLTDHFSTLTVIVQREVADRYVAKPGGADYSSIGVYLQFFSTPKFLFPISKSCFYPPPKIESAALHFTLKKPPLDAYEPFLEMVRCAFNKRRKMLRASLKGKYEGVEEALEKMGKPKTTRPQELSVEEWLILHDQMA